MSYELAVAAAENAREQAWRAADVAFYATVEPARRRLEEADRADLSAAAWQTYCRVTAPACAARESARCRADADFHRAVEAARKRP